MYDVINNSFNFNSPMVWVDFGISVALLALLIYVFTLIHFNRKSFITMVILCVLTMASWFFGLTFVNTLCLFAISATVIIVALSNQNEFRDLVGAFGKRKHKVETEKVSIEIDLKPALSNDTLDQRILREIQNPLNKTVEDLIHKLLPSQFVPWFIGLSHIDKDRTLLNFTKEDRLQILTSLKCFKLTYIGLDDIERAIITSGGISTKEINPKTMESKIVSGLYFAGEIIDVDAFTGGYNMQIAFSTGALVADSIGY
mgnify:CR=1 FL=1